MKPWSWSRRGSPRSRNPALRFDAPIFTYKNILDDAGVLIKTAPKTKKLEKPEDEDAVIEELIKGEDKESMKIKQEDYTKFSSKDLEKMLKEAVSNEDYEKAARIRDEISKRQK